MAKLPVAAILLWAIPAYSSDPLNILDYAPKGTNVDRTGVIDSSQALASAISAANIRTEIGEPACVYIPPGIYRIITPPPSFVRAGCVKGEGPSQSIINIDPQFHGDLFSWSESWIVTTPGPMITGLQVRGSKSASNLQNAFVFYDRNDQVLMENVDVTDLHGRALYSGVSKKSPQAYMRESRLRSLRFFNDGAENVPVVEFNSQGTGRTDATNEIRISQMDIYGSKGPGFVIRNNGDGGVRDITIDALRIEGSENGTTAGDLLTIGDSVMPGNVNNISVTGLELIDPSRGYAALRISAPKSVMVPYQISIQGLIGGGAPAGQGLRIDAARGATFKLTSMHTLDTNVVIASGVTGITLDGNGDEQNWTYSIDPKAAQYVYVPILRSGNPAARNETIDSLSDCRLK